MSDDEYQGAVGFLRKAIAQIESGKWRIENMVATVDPYYGEGMTLTLKLNPSPVSRLFDRRPRSDDEAPSYIGNNVAEQWALLNDEARQLVSGETTKWAKNAELPTPEPEKPKRKMPLGVPVRELDID